MQHKLRPTDASPKEHGRKASSYINTPVHSAALGQQGPNAFLIVMGIPGLAGEKQQRTNTA